MVDCTWAFSGLGDTARVATQAVQGATHTSTSTHKKEEVDRAAVQQAVVRVKQWQDERNGLLRAWVGRSEFGLVAQLSRAAGLYLRHACRDNGLLALRFIWVRVRAIEGSWRWYKLQREQARSDPSQPYIKLSRELLTRSRNALFFSVCQALSGALPGRPQILPALPVATVHKLLFLVFLNVVFH